MSLSFYKKIEDSLKQVLILSLYTIIVPLYMLVFTYLLTLYEGRISFIHWDLMPIFMGTVWIPALVALMVNDALRQRKLKYLKENEKLKDYPFVFMASFSVYFFILGLISFGSDCLAIAFSGMLLVLFSFLFKPIKKGMMYLPAAENFYFYTVVFIFPVFVLMATDVSLGIEGNIGFSILLAPISYIPGVSGLAIVSIIRRYWFLKRGKILKKNLLTIDEAISILLVCDIVASLYVVSFMGERIFIMCLFMSTCLYVVEKAFARIRIACWKESRAISSTKPD